MLKARDIQKIDYQDVVLEDALSIASMRNNILAGDVILIKNVLDKELIQRIKQYLINVGRNSLPNYQPIVAGAPNFHRVNVWDNRAYVKGCFHQFSFFPWNQDVFNFFDITRHVFFLKNLINHQLKDKFLGREPEDGCTARLSFQFYPSGQGGMNKHIDPVDHHQLTVPTLVMSKRGLDYERGGLFVENQQGEMLFVEDECEIGDVVFFNAQIPHGVKTIDEHARINWLSFTGRWMMIFATNKLNGHQVVADATEIMECVRS